MNKLSFSKINCRIILTDTKLFSLLVLIFYLSLYKITYADNVLVNIEFQFNNIATTRNNSTPLFKAGDDFKRAPDEIDKYYQKFKNNVNLDKSLMFINCLKSFSMYVFV